MTVNLNSITLSSLDDANSGPSAVPGGSSWSEFASTTEAFRSALIGDAAWLSSTISVVFVLCVGEQKKTILNHGGQLVFFIAGLIQRYMMDGSVTEKQGECNRTKFMYKILFTYFVDSPSFSVLKNRLDNLLKMQLDRWDDYSLLQSILWLMDRLELFYLWIFKLYCHVALNISNSWYTYSLPSTVLLRFEIMEFPLRYFANLKIIW